MHPIVRLTLLALLTVALQGIAVGPAAAQSASVAAAADDPDAEDAGPARPARNPSFYRADVPVVSQSEKRSALIRGLGQVVIRLTGDLKAPSNNVIRKAASNIDAFVTGSSFRQDAETVNGVPV